VQRGPGKRKTEGISGEKGGESHRAKLGIARGFGSEQSARGNGLRTGLVAQRVECSNGSADRFVSGLATVYSLKRAIST